ncbi:MAG: hypothetical protein ACI9WT_002048 [Flavobacterium sp.]|jgi:hypothetical protein
MGRFSCLFFVLFSTAALAQTAIQAKLNGRVITNFSAPDGFYVVNLNTEQVEFTDEEGYFSILAVVGDALLFSAAEFKRTRVIVTSDDFLEKLLLVQMEPILNELNEVVIRRYDNINAVSLGIIPSDQRSYTAAERKLKAATGLDATATAGAMAGGSVSADPLLNFISGRTAMLRKELKVEKKQFYLKQLVNMFNEDHFVNNLNIPLDHVTGFQYYAVENEQFTKILSSKNLILTEFLLAELATKYNKIIPRENQ